MYVVARAGTDGSLEVVERVRTAVSVTVLPLRPPRSTSAPGTSGVTPTVVGLQAEAGGAVVSDVPTSPLPATGARLTLPSAAKDIVMRYRLESGADRSQPAPVGRVLIALSPITAADASLRTLKAVVEVVGGSVRNLVCPDLPVSDQLCGRQHGTIWSTTAIPLATSAVVAQVDLPQPGDR